MSKNILSLNHVFFEGEELSQITGVTRDFEKEGIYTAFYSEIKENFSDTTNHYKVYWDINEFYEAESKNGYDWDLPHTISFIGNMEDARKEIEKELEYIKRFPTYGKKFEIGNVELEILHRPQELYPEMHDVIYWAFAKDNFDEYYKVYWNVINMFEPFKIEMTTDYSRYCKKCLKVWTNTDRPCIDEEGHEYVLNSPLENVMGVDEAAELWGLSAGTIKNYCAEGKVEAKKIGKTWIINKNQENPSQLKKESNENNG